MRSQAVLVAIGIHWEGRRNVLAVEMAHRESGSSWRELLVSLRPRSLQGVEFVVSDHAGLRRAIQEVLPEAVWHASAYYTTFQSSFILKTIGLGQAQSTAVYGRNGQLAPVPAPLASLDPVER